MPADTAFMDKLVALCKRRGFIYPSSEIYGGINGFWDYGPLGVLLKNHIKQAWWEDMVLNPPDGPDGREITMVGLDCSIIMNPKVWEASGHAEGFADPMVDCTKCKGRFRADKVFVLEVRPPADRAQLESLEQQLAQLGVQGDIATGPALTASIEADGYEEALAACGEALAQVARAENLEDWKRPSVTRFPGEPRGIPAGAGVPVLVTGRSSRVSLGILRTLRAQESAGTRCPRCLAPGSLTSPRRFNLMFRTFVGAVEDASAQAWLRPETAQGIFVNFRNVLDTTRVKLPFGIAQIGKAFRNEINPRNFTFRSREFEQMEIEFFCRGSTEGGGRPPTEAGSGPTDMEWYEFWRRTRFDWYVRHGLRSEKLRLRDQTSAELAHYSRACADVEYLFPFSDEFQELEGVAHRGTFDLTQHQEHSGRDLSYFDDQAWQRDAHLFKEDPQAASQAKNRPPYRFLPTVIEPSAGVDRAALAFLCEAYAEDQAPDERGQMQQRVVMKFHPRLAPIKAAFFPLVNREGMPEVAYRLYRAARRHFSVFYDDAGAIGRRYRRQDEAGTPFCVTVDGQTVREDGTVTIRDRDSLRQVRVHQDRVIDWLRDQGL